MTGLNLDARINLERAELLLLDESLEGMAVLLQIVSAFGVRSTHRCRTTEEAKKAILGGPLDLVLIGANGHDATSYDFIRWLRRSGLEPNAYVPTILISGHTQLRNVQRAVDCGANYIVAKPVSPEVLLERILWVAREKRHFISCDSYVGPDRRFHDLGAPAGVAERRQAEPEAEAELEQQGAAR
jgi:DNA-binding response OmpR family regulator